MQIKNQPSRTLFKQIAMLAFAQESKYVAYEEIEGSIDVYDMKKNTPLEFKSYRSSHIDKPKRKYTRWFCRWEREQHSNHIRRPEEDQSRPVREPIPVARTIKNTSGHDISNLDINAILIDTIAKNLSLDTML